MDLTNRDSFQIPDPVVEAEAPVKRRRIWRPKRKAGSQFEPPFEVLSPARQTAPVVFNSPHSGRTYPDAFLRASKLDRKMIRRSEDSFVDELFAAAPAHGAPLLHARFPRAFLDVNREPYELDPTMFADPLPPHVNTQSVRVAGGLGTIARIVMEATEIYSGPLSFADAEQRIQTLYMPYHQELRRLLKATFKKFGCALLIDCHSMPSIGGPADYDSGSPRPDIVLGDRFGMACAPAVMAAATEAFRDLGYRVAINNPYAGGFITEHYGKPERGLHALQIEINRALYMNEVELEKSAAFADLRAGLTQVIDTFCSLATAELTR